MSDGLHGRTAGGPREDCRRTVGGGLREDCGRTVASLSGKLNKSGGLEITKDPLKIISETS